MLQTNQRRIGALCLFGMVFSSDGCLCKFGGAFYRVHLHTEGLFFRMAVLNCEIGNADKHASDIRV